MLHKSAFRDELFLAAAAHESLSGMMSHVIFQVRSHTESLTAHGALVAIDSAVDVEVPG